MFKRIASSGINLLVLAISIAVFACAFLGMITLSKAQRPATINVLAAGRDLNIGETITQADITEKSVYKDENTALYIPAEQITDVTGGIVALPIAQGQPIMRNAILSPAGEGTRLSAVLARYQQEHGILFPLLLDSQKVIAPDITTFLPGDLIGITVVIDSRPQARETTPEPVVSAAAIENNLPTPTPTPSPEQAALAEALDRSYPPLAKDLFPQGVRIIAIQGLPQSAPSGSEANSSVNADTSSSFMDFNAHQILVLLIPADSREMLSLALQQGQVYISLLARGSDELTPGFSYWDLEDWFKRDREQLLNP